MNDVRSRREQRLDRDALRSQLGTYRTTTELSELSAIAARNAHADTAELRSLLERALSR